MNLQEMIEGYKPFLELRYSDQVRQAFESMGEKLGPELQGVHNSWEFAGTFANLVAPNVSRGKDGRYAIDEAKLGVSAKAYAKAAAAALLARLQSKIEGLEAASVDLWEGNTFTVSGTREGHKIVIHQMVILNVSSQGKVFNQFPARIYVDGKFTGEAAYKELFAKGERL